LWAGAVEHGAKLWMKTREDEARTTSMDTSCCKAQDATPFGNGVAKTKGIAIFRRRGGGGRRLRRGKWDGGGILISAKKRLVSGKVTKKKKPNGGTPFLKQGGELELQDLSQG